MEDFEALEACASQLFTKLLAAKASLGDEELFDAEIFDLKAVRKLVRKGIDVVTLSGMAWANGWCVPVDLTLQCGEKKMAKGKRVERILENLQQLDFAKARRELLGELLRGGRSKRYHEVSIRRL